jgi:hypothetical protein
MKLRFALLATAIVAVATPAFVLPVVAATRDDVMAGAVRCASIADDRTWLDCYYGAAQPMRGSLGLPPAPAAQQRLVPVAGPGAVRPAVTQNNTPPAAKMGFFESLVTHTEQKTERPTRMTSYKFDSGGFFVVTLANGETWRQISGDTAIANWHDRAERYTVTILPAPELGIRQMKVGNEIYQVERVR